MATQIAIYGENYVFLFDSSMVKDGRRDRNAIAKRYDVTWRINHVIGSVWTLCPDSSLHRLTARQLGIPVEVYGVLAAIIGCEYTATGRIRTTICQEPTDSRACPVVHRTSLERLDNERDEDFRYSVTGRKIQLRLSSHLSQNRGNEEEAIAYLSPTFTRDNELCMVLR